MKKATITLEAFEAEVARIERELGLDDVVRAVVPESDPHDAHALIRVLGEGVPVGRGERFVVEVFTLWNAPPFGDLEHPLAELRHRVVQIPGVEETGTPTVDTQLHAIWGFTATLRQSQ